MYGIVFTEAGLSLLASLGKGEQLTITRCMVGSGVIGSREAAKALADLVEPRALASSTEPLQKGSECSFILEYRNDMDGGLETGFNIAEYGVWAQIGGNAEVLLLYGCLADHPQPIPAYVPGGGVDIRRFPVTVGVSNDAQVILGYSAMAFMTAEDVSEYCMVVVLPLFLEEAAELIAAHNVSPIAHQDIRDLIGGLDSRLTLLELMYNTDVNGNPFAVTFESLEGLICTGVWNKEQARLEW